MSASDSKRVFHNERERLRRSTIRSLFDELRRQVPGLVRAEGTSDRQILVERRHVLHAGDLFARLGQLAHLRPVGRHGRRGAAHQLSLVSNFLRP